jgi:DNA-binding transcriptional MerR regulator
VRIGELAKAAGVSPRSLRYYEQRGLLRARRQDNGYREYDDSAVTRVHNIRTLLGAGLKADDIRALDSCLDERDLHRNPDCSEAYDLYEQRLKVVREQLAALAEVERRLEDRLGELRGDPPGPAPARRPV